MSKIGTKHDCGVVLQSLEKPKIWLDEAMSRAPSAAKEEIIAAKEFIEMAEQRIKRAIKICEGG